MKPESEQHSLLDDVLNEAAPADFERALLDGTLRAVRRQRRLRRSSRGLAVAGVLAAIGLAIWHALLPTSRKMLSSSPRSQTFSCKTAKPTSLSPMPAECLLFPTTSSLRFHT